MTLRTTVGIASPVPVTKVWDYCQGLLGDPCCQHHELLSDGTQMHYQNERGQGLPALLSMDVAIDGPLVADSDDEEPHPFCLRVAFDTAYSYKTDTGESCSDLHRRLTAALGAWLDDQGADWWAQDEFTGTWHHRRPVPVAI